MNKENSFYPEKYYALVTSLPDIVLPLSAYKNIPLTDEELKSRITMMSEADAQEVVKAVSFLTRQSLNNDDDAIKNEFYEILQTTQNQGLKEIIEQNMRLRTLLSAAILSCSDKKLPPLKEDEVDSWGYDLELMTEIRENWNHPNFSLDDSLPNIVSLRKLINHNKSADMQEWVENMLWNFYIEQDTRFEFTVENVALFIIKRQMIKNRLERNSEKTITIIKNAVTNMIDKMELNL